MQPILIVPALKKRFMGRAVTNKEGGPLTSFKEKVSTAKGRRKKHLESERLS